MPRVHFDDEKGGSDLEKGLNPPAQTRRASRLSYEGSGGGLGSHPLSPLLTPPSLPQPEPSPSSAAGSVRTDPFSRHFGSDAQKSTWLSFITAGVYLLDWGICWWKHRAASAFIYGLSLLVISWGAYLEVDASYPENVESASFYKKNGERSVSPPPGAKLVGIHLGTTLLRASFLELLGGVIFVFGAFCEVFLDNFGDGLLHFAGGVLFVALAYFQNLSQYPENMLRPHDPSVVAFLESLGREGLISHLGTDLLLSGWLSVVLGVYWFFSSVYWIDSFEFYAEVDPSAWVSLVLSCFLLSASYFALHLGYAEGSRLDTLLMYTSSQSAVAEARGEDGLTDPDPSRRTSWVIQNDLAKPLLTPPPVRSNEAKGWFHPLDGVQRLRDYRRVDIDEVINTALDWLVDESSWKPEADAPLGIDFYTHGPAARIRDVVEVNQPLLLACLVRSETFKEFSMGQIPNQAATQGHKKPGVICQIDHLTSGQYNSPIYFQRAPADPPLPPSESIYVSVVKEVGPNRVCVVEWSVDCPDHKLKQSRDENASSSQVALLHPFTVHLIEGKSEEGCLMTSAMWTPAGPWLPDVLVKEQLRKVSDVQDDLAVFMENPELVKLVVQQTEQRIWQRVHRGITPLLTGVLFRHSPAYRHMISKFPGLRATVPDKLPYCLLSGDQSERSPLEYLPSSIGGVLVPLQLPDESASEADDEEEGDDLSEEPFSMRGKSNTTDSPGGFAGLKGTRDSLSPPHMLRSESDKPGGRKWLQTPSMSPRTSEAGTPTVGEMAAFQRNVLESGFNISRRVTGVSVDWAQCVALAVAFTNNEYEDWKHTSGPDPAAPKSRRISVTAGMSRSFKSKDRVTVWRRKVLGEAFDPFRVQVRLESVDPLTLAHILHSTEFRKSISEGQISEIKVVQRLAGYHGDHGSDIKVKIVHEKCGKATATSRPRESVYVSVLKEVSPVRVVLVDWAVDWPVDGQVDKPPVRTRPFQCFILENDGGVHTKVIMSSLVSVGGKTEKYFANFAGEPQKLKATKRMLEMLISYFQDSPVGRRTVENMRTRLLKETWTPVLHGLSGIQKCFLYAFSDTYNSMVGEFEMAKEEGHRRLSEVTEFGKNGRRSRGASGIGADFQDQGRGDREAAALSSKQAQSLTSHSAAKRTNSGTKIRASDKKQCNVQ